MDFREIAEFDVVRGRLAWPWIAFDASGTRLAYASSANTIATRTLDGEEVSEGPVFVLPTDLELETARPAENAPPSGLTGFALSFASSDGMPLLAVTGTAHGVATIAILEAAGEPSRSDLSCRERKRVTVDALLGDGHAVLAIAFDRRGRRLWVSSETANETVVALVDVDSLALVDVVRSAPFPRPALHELYLHPQDDAVLLLAACGDDGTFARVVGFAGDVVSAIPSALDSGGLPAGFVGFSADAARVHLAEADELRTHGWPTLDELSSVPFADDFVSSFSGAVLGNEILVDGEDAETQEDAIMLFDRTAIRGVLLPRPAPRGMWAGRLGSEAIVTVQAKGDPVVARVLLRPASFVAAAKKWLMH
jgi:hypothetical protein